MAYSANYRSAVIQLIFDLNARFAKGDPTFPETFCIPAVGNFAHECGGFEHLDEISPTVKGSLGGISFAQWTGMGKNGRRKPFMDFCKANKLHPYGYQAGIGFLIKELSTTEKRAFTLTKNAHIGKGKDPLSVRVVEFEEAFERAGAKHYPSRIKHAQQCRQIWQQWNADGRPAFAPWKSPRGRFSAQFDREYGPVVPYAMPANAKAFAPPAPVVEHPAEPMVPRPQKPAPIETADIDPYEPSDADMALIGDDIVEAEPTAAEVGLIDDPGPVPDAEVTKGRWPEQSLTADEIRAIQKRLYSLGWVMVGKFDGRWNESVVSTIKRVQRAGGIVEDGHWGPQTRGILARGIRFVPSQSRQAVTSKTLKDLGEPTVTNAASIEKTTLWTGITGSLAVASKIFTDYVAEGWQTVKAFKADFGDLPWLITGVLVLVVCFVLYKRAKEIKQQRVHEEQIGANTAFPVPLPAPAFGAEAAELPWADEPVPAHLRTAG